MIPCVAVAALGFVLTWWLIPRLTDDRLCIAFALASYLVKILLTAFFYYASFYHWPILTSYQGEPGFWVFGEDAVSHHFLGRHLCYAWTGVAPFPNIEIGNWSFIVYVGLIYRLFYLPFGVHPLNVVFLNAWWGTAIIAAGIVMLRRWEVSQSSMRLGTALLAFWPSLIFWSTQMMKDPVFLALIMVGLCWLVMMTNPRVRSGPRLLILPACLGALTFLLTLVRDYTGFVFWLTTMGTAGLFVLKAIRARAWPARPFLFHLLLSAVLVSAGFAVAKPINLSRLAPRAPIASPHTRATSAPVHEATTPATPFHPEKPVSPPPVRQDTPAPTSGSAPARPSSVTPSTPVPHPVPPALSQAPIIHAKPPEALSQLKPAVVSQSAHQHAGEAPLLYKRKGTLQKLRCWIHGTLSRASTHALYAARQGFISTGGYSLIDPKVSLDNPVKTLRYLGRGLWIALFSPFPTQWFDVGGRTRVFRLCSMVEMVLVYLLVFAFIWRIGEARKYLGIRTGVVLIFVVLTAIPMSLTVANLGTLFRLRLQFLIPLLLLMCVVDIWGFYRRLRARIS